MLVPQITVEEAESLLQRSTEREQALAILAQSKPQWILRLAANFVASFAVFQLLAIDAPLIVRIALAFACANVPIGFIDQWWLRRRLDAAITLIKLSQDARG